MNDKLLFEKVREGDKQAYEKLFYKYYKPLIRFIWGYVKSKAIAEEIVQELFMKIWAKSSELEIKTSVKSYLFSASRNMSLDYLKHRDVVQAWENEKKATYADKPYKRSVSNNVHNKIILEQVEEAIKSLPERQRLIFILSRYHDMTYKEIAQFLDISDNTVETHIVRALAKLRNKFSKVLALVIVFIL